MKTRMFNASHLTTVKVLLALALPLSAGAQSYPSKPVRIVVNSAPGGAVDGTSRFIAQHLSEELHQNVFVENRPGGGGLLGIRLAKSAAADGYTLLAASSTLTILPSIKKDPGFDVNKDFAPVGSILRMPFVLVTATTTPYKNLQDMLSAARNAPAKVTFASAGIGTTTHLAAAKLFKSAGREAMHVPYNGNGAAMADVQTGRVELLFEQYGVALPLVQAGKLRILGASTAARPQAAPDVPTIAEQGVPGYEHVNWTGLFLPAGAPKDVVQRLNDALKRVLSKKEVIERIRSGGDEPLTMSPTQFQTFVEGEVAKMAALVADLGIDKD